MSPFGVTLPKKSDRVRGTEGDSGGEDVSLWQVKSVTSEPDQTRPDQTRSDQTRPDQTRPDQTRPDQTTPVQTRPEHTRPPKV